MGRRICLEQDARVRLGFGGSGTRVDECQQFVAFFGFERNHLFFMHRELLGMKLLIQGYSNDFTRQN